MYSGFRGQLPGFPFQPRKLGDLLGTIGQGKLSFAMLNKTDRDSLGAGTFLPLQHLRPRFLIEEIMDFDHSLDMLFRCLPALSHQCVVELLW